MPIVFGAVFASLLALIYNGQGGGRHPFGAGSKALFGPAAALETTTSLGSPSPRVVEALKRRGVNVGRTRVELSPGQAAMSVSFKDHGFLTLFAELAVERPDEIEPDSIQLVVVSAGFVSAVIPFPTSGKLKMLWPKIFLYAGSSIVLVDTRSPTSLSPRRMVVSGSFYVKQIATSEAMLTFNQTLPSLN